MNAILKTLALILPTSGFAVSMTGCSNDNNDEPQNSQEIRFTAVADKAPRSASTTTATLQNFNVYAYTGGKPFRENVKVTKSGGSWSYSPAMYWPSTPVNFYAYSPDMAQLSSVSTTGDNVLGGFKNQGNIDLLYAVTLNQAAKATPVTLNFKHALARVEVWASSTNSDIKVDVAHIALNNVKMQGDFTFPTTSTLPEDESTSDLWSNLDMTMSPLIFYAFGPEDDIVLTPSPTEVSGNNLDSHFMIPQPLEDTSISGSAYTGNYISIDCKIYDAASGALLWPNSNTPAYQLVDQSEYGRIVFPLKSTDVTDWKAGTAYIYNIRIDNPSELDKIDFDVTVEEYK